MGLIIRESLKQTIVRIGLSVIGALATLFIFPLDRELYGIFGFVLDTALILMPLILLGLAHSSIRFFPYRSGTLANRKSFFYFLLKLLFINIILAAILFYLFHDYLIKFSQNPSQDFSNLFQYIFPAAVLFSVVQFLVLYISNFRIVTLPIVIQNLYKIVMPIAFVLVFYKLINKLDGIMMILISLGLSALIMVIYCFKVIGSTKYVKLKDDADETISKRRFFSYYFWVFANSIGSLMAFKIDGYMVPALTNFESAGDYRMSIFIASVIALPITSVVAISNPIVSQAWKENDLKEISDVYNKSSKNLFYIGAVMLLAILILLDFLPIFLEKWKALTHLKLIVAILGFAKLMDMGSGVNGVIIQHSKWFKYNTLFIIILMVLNVVLNFIFIQAYGIVGAAIATSISLIVFNGMKAVLLYVKTRMAPFGWETLYFLTIFLILLVISFVVPKYTNQFVAMTINCLLALVFSVYFLLQSEMAAETRNSLLKILNQFNS